jgi:CDP-glucose 4,6-dehydratase
LVIRQSAVEDVVSAALVDPDGSFWRGKRVLLTGHTGFKGAWLSLWLQRLGADVTGVALPPATQPNLFTLTGLPTGMQSRFCDIRDAPALAEIVSAARPEIALHLAAQPLVRPGYRDPRGTFATNIMGTAHLLDAIRGVDSLRAMVVVTTDKVYRVVHDAPPYREDDALGGHDPYSASKAAAEIVVASYRDAFLDEQGVAVATARAGNVIGGGDWSEDRLIPDAIRAWQAAATLEVRRPASVRPWQHVLEPLAGYLVLAERIHRQPELAGPFNFGPRASDAVTVREVIELAQAAYGGGRVHFASTATGPHETPALTLDTSKAEKLLGVTPRWRLAEAVKRTIAWYRAVHAGGDPRALCAAELDAYATAV